MTLTKAHIIEALFSKNIFTKIQSAQIIEALFELIKQSLQNGEDALISGLGKFSVKEEQQRVGRNPQTGEPLKLAPRKVVTFKCSNVLRAAINGNSDMQNSQFGLYAERCFGGYGRSSNLIDLMILLGFRRDANRLLLLTAGDPMP
jgi:integration host factor subunit alpha